MTQNTKTGLGIAVVLVVVVLGTYFISSKPKTVTQPDQPSTAVVAPSGTVAGESATDAVSTEQFVGAGCYVGGCSKEVCSGSPGATSSCVYQDFFACFKTARCEKQADNKCGWTPTTQLIECTKGDK